MLVVVNQTHLALKSWVVVVLTHLEVITATQVCSWSETLAIWLCNVIVSWVLSELIVEGSLAVASSVEWSESTIITRNISVTTSAIVGVDNWLGVDMGEWLSRPLFLNDEAAF